MCLRLADQANKRGEKVGRNADVPPHQKRCPKCGEVKDREGNFRIRSSERWTGVQAWCVACERKDGAERARRNKDKKAAYYAANREHVAERGRARYQLMKQDAEWVARKNECARRTTDRERVRGYSAAWRAANKERIAERNRLWRQNNQDTYKAGKRNYRARKRGAAGSHTQEDVEARLISQKRRCWWCEAKLQKYEVDHLIPLSKGGSNGPENIVLACGFCNRSKGAKMPWEFTGDRLL